jgi:hypothetical protein
VHSERTVRTALQLADIGATATDIARQLGVPRRTVADWLGGALPHSSEPGAGCRHDAVELSLDYVYLLGLYLGDGCISQHRRGVHKLRIFLDVKYPEIIANAAAAIRIVRCGSAGMLLRPRHCVEVYSFWKSWPHLFPQHGPGKKHERPIVLADWQEQLVDRWPEQLLRGLIHSDGCRFQNTGTNWSWPRYAFKQVSADIRNIFCHACDRLGVHWTQAKTTVYVSRKADVAILDEFIGPKR